MFSIQFSAPYVTGVFPIYFYYKIVSLAAILAVPMVMLWYKKKGKGKVLGVPQTQPIPDTKRETDETKQLQIEQTYEKH